MSLVRHRPLLAVLAFAFGGTTLVARPGPAASEVRRGDRARDLVSAVDEAGRRVSLRSFQDAVVVMTFGASWCKPCKQELPALEKLARRYDEAGKRVVFLAVNVDEEKAKGKRFMSNAGLKKVRAVYDPQKSTVESYDPPKMPTTFIIRRGIVKHVHAGFSAGDEKSIAEAIDRALR